MKEKEREREGVDRYRKRDEQIPKINKGRITRLNIDRSKIAHLRHMAEKRCSVVVLTQQYLYTHSRDINQLCKALEIAKRCNLRLEIEAAAWKGLRALQKWCKLSTVQWP